MKQSLGISFAEGGFSADGLRSSRTSLKSPNPRVIRRLLLQEREAESLKSQLTETRELVTTPGEERDPLVALQERSNVDSRVAALQKDNAMLNYTVRKLTKEVY